MEMRQAVIAFVALLSVAVGGSVASVAVASTPAGLAPSERVATASLAAEICSKVCRECEEDEHQNHSLCDSWDDECTHGGSTHGSECVFSAHSCDGSEHSCTPPLAPAPVAGMAPNDARVAPLYDPAFWAAVRQADRGSLEAFVRRNPGIVEVNAGRQSLQVVGCGGDIIANIPLQESQMPNL